MEEAGGRRAAWSRRLGLQAAARAGLRLVPGASDAQSSAARLPDRPCLSPKARGLTSKPAKKPGRQGQRRGRRRLPGHALGLARPLAGGRARARTCGEAQEAVVFRPRI